MTYCLGSCLVAVSYTHLDVYKRQITYSIFLRTTVCSPAIQYIRCEVVITVSYTHLDVYKRQVALYPDVYSANVFFTRSLSIIMFIILSKNRFICGFIAAVLISDVYKRQIHTCLYHPGEDILMFTGRSNSTDNFCFTH